VGKPPYDVPDACVTKEWWLTRKTKFVLKKEVVISYKLTEMMHELGNVGSISCIKRQSEVLKKLKKHRELYS
jgi:putative transposon-encoded protein